MQITFETIKQNERIKTYIRMADASLQSSGFTEHSFAHVIRTADFSGRLLESVGRTKRVQELGQIAGYLHDIGNIVNRVDHAQSGAIMAFRLLDELKMEPQEIATIVSAIGNHDEKTGAPVHDVAAALILADKSDVRRTRVRNRDISSFDIHDRVNYAVTNSKLQFAKDSTEILLSLSIDTEISPILSYFEIFMERMVLCTKAAAQLERSFGLMINGQRVL